jgi:hypothetical protein
LPPVLHELAGPEAEAEGAEATASVDGRQLPVIADQDHLGPGAVSVLEQPGELAAADHAGLIDHQHGACVQLLLSSVEVAEESVAGGHVLESLPLQAHGGDPGRGRCQEPVAAQLPGMAGDAEGEGLAGPGSPDDEGDPLAALAEVADHRLLIRSGGWMGGQGLAHCLMGGDRRLFPRSTSGALDQSLFDRQQLWGGPAAFLQGPVGDHADRPLGQEPVRQPLEFAPSGPSQTGAQGGQDVRAGEGGRGRGQPVWAGQQVEQPTGHLSGHRPILVAIGCPTGHLPDQVVRIHAALGRLSPPAVVQGVRSLVLLWLPSGVHGPLDQPWRPLPTIRSQPVELGIDLAGALGEAADQRLGHPSELAVAMLVSRRPLHS